jgi:vacuolar-type H+-ATPase subunit D/Vma8
MQIEEINSNLDKILLECFSCYEESKKLREELTSKYKDGMMHLAKARVALWPMGKITQDEYDMRMKANKMVTVSSNGGSEDYTTFLLENIIYPTEESEEEPFREPVSKNSEVRQRKKAVVEEQQEDIPSFAIPSNEDFVKQFMESKKIPTFEKHEILAKDSGLSFNNEMNNKVEEKEKTLWSTKKSNEPSNPIQWFGYLPCLPLKNSQRCFSTSLEIIITLANIEKKLDFLIQKYGEFKLMKANYNSSSKINSESQAKDSII